MQLWNRRERGQTFVLAAVALVGVLAFVGLVLNMGLFLVQRRHLQSAADAMALAATWRVLDEQTSGVYLDSAVLAAAQQMATQNSLSIPTDVTLQASYLDQSGTVLGTVGGGTMPHSSAGVRISLVGPFQTLLAAFVGLQSIQASAQADARLVPVASPGTLTTAVPLVVAQSTYLTTGSSSYDLYTLANPFLDLTSIANGGTAATSFGNMHTNLQYWSDGSHAVGTLTSGSTVTFAGSGYGIDVQTGLLDNVRRENLPNDPLYAGLGVAPYILVNVPLCNPCSSPTATIVGYARFKILQSQISAAHVIGTFVPYVDDPTSTSRQSGPLQGPAIVVLTS